MNPLERVRSQQTKVDLHKGKSIAASASTTRRLMEPMDANIQGNVHGGVIMRMVDDAAAIVAIKHSQRATVVTASIERFDFLAPAFIGDVVSVHCALNYVGRTSMEIGVEVTAEDVLTGEIRKIASSNVIYVALDEHRKPTPVPPLAPANDEEAQKIEQSRLRRARIKQVEEDIAKLQ